MPIQNFVVKPLTAQKNSNRTKHIQQPQKKVQSGPISRVLSKTIIPLGAPSPTRSSNLPASDAGHAMDAYLVLLQVGFTVPVCYQTRGALLPHRFTLTTHPKGPFGGLLSAALSVGSHRPAVNWHLALRSPDFPPLRQSRRPLQRRPSSPLCARMVTKPDALRSSIFQRNQPLILLQQLRLTFDMRRIMRNAIIHRTKQRTLRHIKMPHALGTQIRMNLVDQRPHTNGIVGAYRLADITVDAFISNNQCHRQATLTARSRSLPTTLRMFISKSLSHTNGHELGHITFKPCNLSH